MKLVKGKYNEAKIFTNVIEEGALQQVQELCDMDFLEGTKIRMMPDVHAGKGCTIGTTIKLNGKVVPDHVGVDIGCGVLTVKLNDKKIDFQKLDDVINNYVPSGSANHEEPRYFSDVTVEDYRIKNHLSQDRMDKARSSLGGGNHYIEISLDTKGLHYLTIHTGSRYVGAKVAEYYQKLANKKFKSSDIKKVIDELKRNKQHHLIEEKLNELREENKKYKGVSMYLEGKELEDYLYDINLAQGFAKENRHYIAKTIIDEMGFEEIDMFDTIHNYIDVENMILRKGAVSAQKGERLIIPINMRDGSILATGKGNEDWNFSAPHGAGRVLSRTQARKNLNLTEFQEQMSDVWTKSAVEETIDEAPAAYKSISDIVENIGETVAIDEIITPVYNFKGKDEIPFWMKKKDEKK